MLAAIKAGDFPEVLYAKDDKRLFRNEREAGRLIEWIWEQEVEIRYCLMDFGDPRENDEQWFMQRQFHIIAELERRRKRTEVFEHQRQNALNGYSNGGLPPYGYQRKEVVTSDKKKKLTWEINPKEVNAIKKAFEMHLDGVGVKMIAYQLTQEGLSVATWCPDEQTERRRMVSEPVSIRRLYRLEHPEPQSEAEAAGAVGYRRECLSRNYLDGNCRANISKSRGEEDRTSAKKTEGNIYFQE